MKLPIKQGMLNKCGSNASLLYDADGSCIAQVFGIPMNTSMEEMTTDKALRKKYRQAMQEANQITRAVNNHDELVDALRTWEKFWNEMPKGQLSKIVCNIGLLNEGFIKMRRVLAKEN